MRAAGDQGAVTLHVSCDNGLEQDINIAANAPAGDTATTIEDLPVGTVCTVTEPTNGSSAGVSVTTDIVGSPATITAAEVGVDVTNTYETVLSSLVVTKTIAGGAAGDQGAVTLHVSCDNDLEQDINIPANAPAGDTATTIEDLPVGTVCTVTEPTNGSSAGVSVTTDIVGSPATITAAEVGVDVTNTYETVLSSLVVTKTIAGGAAGDQGAVTLHVSCDNDLEQDINIPANAPAGDTATTIEDLPVGTVCTVTEPTNGSSAGVSVTTDIVGSPATITAAEVGVDVTNTYETVLSSLVVTKTIAGGAAGDQGAVTLHVSCDNDLEQDINIPANAPAGDTATTIEDLPVGTVCTVTEPTNGSSAGVSVTTDIVGSPATITAAEVGVDVTNTYEQPTTPDTPGSSDAGEETSTSSGSGGDLASTGASAGLGLMAALGVALLVGAGAFLSASHRRHKAK